LLNWQTKQKKESKGEGAKHVEKVFKKGGKGAGEEKRPPLPREKEGQLRKKIQPTPFREKKNKEIPWERKVTVSAKEGR